LSGRLVNEATASAAHSFAVNLEIEIGVVIVHAPSLIRQRFVCDNLAIGRLAAGNVFISAVRGANGCTGMEPVVYALTQLHRVVLFSNTNAAHVAHIKANYQVFGHVHAAYLSHELGLVKPDAASFLFIAMDVDQAVRRLAPQSHTQARLPTKQIGASPRPAHP
jgi:hypothetical protein